MKRLIVDMDGVLADVYSQFLDFEEKEFGFRQPLENLLGKPESEVFKNERIYVNSAGFFRNAPVMEGSIAAMEALNKSYELFIVSAAMEFPRSLPEKYEWLNEHFPFLTWKQIVFCGSKTVIQGDIMIDDHYKNLDYFKGKTILFTQPHNYSQPDNGHTRVSSWQEIIKLLL
ncbi:MAG: 5'(3')-deoxyribonucleotidase [Ferruginibacter sp.]